LILLKRMDKDQTVIGARVRQHLAAALREQNMYTEAEVLAREALAIDTRLDGHDTADMAGDLDDLAMIAWKQKKMHEAEVLDRRSMQIKEMSLGENDVSVALTLSNLGLVLEREGQFSESEEVQRRTLAITMTLFGNEHPDVALALDNLGQTLRAEGKLEEARSAFQEALAIRRSLLGNQHVYTMGSLGNLLSVLAAEGAVDPAEKLFDEILTPAFESSPQANAMIRARGTFRARMGRFEEAKVDLARAVALNPNLYFVWMQLAAILAQSGDDAGYRKVCAAMQSRFGKTPDRDAADWIAYTCLLLPVSGNGLEAARLADFAVGVNSESPLAEAASPAFIAFAQLVKGLSEYRKGHDEAAVKWTRKALDYQALAIPEEAAAHSVAAMALFELKQSTEARAQWREAENIQQRKFSKLECGYLYWHFHNLLIAQILHRESGVLLYDQLGIDTHSRTAGTTRP
jgi:tetratricopeptide (TPR) repeat protein